MLSAIYQKSMASIGRRVPEKLQPLWKHPAGPQTVFFWGPIVKWGLVLAGIGDLTRPADQLSVKQYSSLAATGFIWSRYCLVIIPKNYSLCAVNFFVGLTGAYQVARALNHQRQQDALEAAAAEN
ncbi:Hypothetical predicted protein [Cloeon dipterum]|uniref:Mitochondrial pyruvate carrier n=1 Tax=Cloeon dipterum TaxID=197152 RepID=A0A8S1D2L1_9INSE|nr:Hypothetical predicted protein [Cloeon dipterum]